MDATDLEPLTSALKRSARGFSLNLNLLASLEG